MSTPAAEPGTKFVAIYDGDCPFCRSYVAYSALKQRFSELVLIDARTRPDLVEEYRRRGFDLNEGMVVIENGEIYYAARAMERIALHAGGYRRGNALLARLMANAKAGDRIYSLLNAGRRMTLKLLGRTQL